MRPKRAVFLHTNLQLIDIQPKECIIQLEIVGAVRGGAELIMMNDWSGLHEKATRSAAFRAYLQAVSSYPPAMNIGRSGAGGERRA